MEPWAHVMSSFSGGGREGEVSGGETKASTSDGTRAKGCHETAEENEHYNLSTVELIRQVYGFTPPQSDEVNATKQAILKDVIERRELPHDKYVAVFHQISDGTERIFFTFKRSRKETNTLYLIESRNRDSIKAFYGRN